MITATRTNPELPGFNIVCLQGRLGVRAEQDLLDALEKAVDAADSGLILDMADVEFVSSSGLRTLMLVYKKADAAGKKLGMVQVRPAVYKIFKLTASEKMFLICDTEEAAVEALR